MADRLEKLINIVKKTGGKLVFSNDVNFDDFYVILALKDYEEHLSESKGIRHLTEEELADKINRDIAIWKNEQNQYDFDLNYDDFKEEHDSEEALTELFDQALENENESEEIEKKDVVDDFVEEERIEEIVDDNFDSVAKILAVREQEEIKEIQIEEEEKKGWSIPKDRKQQAQGIADEKSYLEEISF